MLFVVAIWLLVVHIGKRIFFYSHMLWIEKQEDISITRGLSKLLLCAKISIWRQIINGPY